MLDIQAATTTNSFGEAAGSALYLQQGTKMEA
jgi:hypothetical protein